MLRMIMKKINRFYVVMAVMMFSALACGLPGGGSENQPEAPTKLATSSPTEVRGEPFISAPGIANIQPLTEITGAGEKPLFMWESVSGASRYQLIVFDEEGDPYWAWEGTKTQIYMGGTDTPPPNDSSGPSIDTGYTWAVVAYGSDGKVLAASEVRSISP